jgi:N-acetylglucosamine malate deacetylase 1
VQIVFVTDGAASHDVLTGRDPALVSVRRQEALRAAAILGVDAVDVHFLDLPDGRLQSLSSPERQQAIDRLRELIDAARPDEVYVPHRHDRTDDHEATYVLAMAAVQASRPVPKVFQYAVWMLWSSLVFRDFTIDELRGARRLSIQAVRDQKRQALLAHRSQWMPGAQQGQAVLEPGFLHRFCLPDEVYFHTETPAPAARAAGA